MTRFAVSPLAPTTLPIQGSDAVFPVRRVFCVGRNYGAHVREMGGDTKDQPPLFFTKPADAVVAPGGAVTYPPGTSDFHHEMELVVALKAGGADVAPSEALELVYGYAAGVDLTRRDLQTAAKKAGQPWDSAKAFDASAPVGAIRPATGEAPAGAIRLSVNGQVRQDGRLGDMIWSVEEIIAEVSRLWRLEAGDLIFTGTPEGVGALARGDFVEGEIEGVGSVAFTVA
ncbi:fumarylacetoacetate hydrolase family protein [Caulobacter sp. S45]|uniref:fumarylacetoacetate hydrolase family protein n=1 Tax=Caulobacter sp. S45 TaxID=1641861 RepID=UPI001576D982|nr:fumarylacetoacetate hydrolase family protein [Caulobacter sp. S45]